MRNISFSVAWYRVVRKFGVGSIQIGVGSAPFHCLTFVNNEFMGGNLQLDERGSGGPPPANFVKIHVFSFGGHLGKQVSISDQFCMFAWYG